MSKKASPESKILDFFESVSLPEARIMFNVIATRLRQREVLAAPPAPAKTKVKAKRRTKAEMTAAVTAMSAAAASKTSPAEELFQ